MKAKLLLIPLVIAGISSCSTAYKTAQTPDDVYFSPPPPHADYVSSHNDENKVINNDGQVTTTTPTTPSVLGTKIPTEQPSTSAPVRTFRTTPTTNSGTGVGNFIRKVFSSSGSDDNSSAVKSTESRSSSSSSSSSSRSSSSSSSSSAPVRTFHK